MKKRSMLNKFVAFTLSCAMLCSIMLPADLQVEAAATTPYGTLAEGEEILFNDYFDNVASATSLTAPWVQEGKTATGGASDVKTITSTSAHSTSGSITNVIKVDSNDSVSLPLDTTSKENIKVYYVTRASSYASGSVIIEYSANGGSTWSTIEEYKLTVPAGSTTTSESNKVKTFSLGNDSFNNPNFKIRIKVASPITGNIYLDTFLITGTSMVSSTATPTSTATATPTATTTPTPTPTPTPTTPPVSYNVTGPELQLFTDSFDDPDAYGTLGSVTIPSPWTQGDTSITNTALSSSAPSQPNMVKFDKTDDLSLTLDTRAYANLKINYDTRAGSTIGTILTVDYSVDNGSTWINVCEIKGDATDIRVRKSQLLSYAANKEKVIVRFKVKTSVDKSNIYIDNFSVTGQSIENMTHSGPVIVEPVPAPVPPYSAPDNVIFYQDVLIGKAGSKDIFSSIAVPKAPSATPLPVIVYIHGGGWNHGSRTEQFSKTVSYAQKGYVGVVIDYRLTPEAPFPAQIQDVKLAIRYLRANAAKYNIDTNRIGVWGSSAGGHLASLLGTTSDLTPGAEITLDNGHTVNVPDMDGNGGWQEYSDRVQAVVDFSGPADFTTDFANNYSSVSKLLGTNAFSVPDTARLAMPGTYASSDDPPFFIRHGDADLTIPYQDSVKFNDQLTAANVPVIDYKIVPGQGHGFTGTDADQANAEAWAFLDKYAKSRTVTEKLLYKPGFNPVNLDETSFSLMTGKIKNLTATVTSSTNPGNTVVWTSTNSAVAAVSAAGEVKGVGTGIANIRATVYDAEAGKEFYKECVINVIDSSTSMVIINPSKLTMNVGDKRKPDVTVYNAAPSVTWYTYNSQVATVDANGLITALGKGSTKIRVTVSDSVYSGIYADCEVSVLQSLTIAVSPASIILNQNDIAQLTARVSDPSKPVAWTSSKSNVATVDANGLVRAVGAGNAKIRASVSESVYAECDVAVNINIDDNSGGSNDDSANGTGGSQNNTPTPTVPPVNTNENGVDISAILDQIKNAAGKELIINIPDNGKSDQAEVTLPVEVFEKIQAKGIEKIQLTGAAASLLIPSDTISTKDVRSVTVNVKQADKARDLTPAQQNIVGDNQVYEFEISVKKADGSESKVSKFNKPVEVSIPYTLKPGEDPRRITVFFIGDNGELENRAGKYDTATGKVTFSTNHFSKYFAKYNNVSFNDLAGVSWAKDQIEVMAAKGIINGTGNSTFSPESNITRADFLMLLVKTLGLTANVDSNFSDVKSTDYYYDAVGAAKKLGLTNGTGNNTFEPQKEISREEMMSLVARALKLADKLGSSGTTADLQAFKDKNDISEYALTNIATLVKEGIITGNGVNIEPKQSTTRAEAAVLLYRIYNK